MENWTNEIWVAIGIAFIVGLFIGYIIVRLTKGSVKHQAKTEAELKTVKTNLIHKKHKSKNILQKVLNYSKP